MLYALKKVLSLNETSNQGLNKQIEEARAKRTEAEKQLEAVKKGVTGDTAEREKAGTLKSLAPSEAESAEQVNQAANDNKASSVVIQQNDNSQQSSTEQKTVVEQNKELSGTGSAAALSRAVETAL